MSSSLLLVDDDADLRRQLERAFGRRGFEVRTAADGERAVELAADRAPDWAVVDLRLGRENGMRIIRHLLRIHPEMRIVVLTGYGSIATAIEAVRSGAIDYLTKPADTEDLIAALQQTADARPRAEVPREPPSLARAEWEHIQRVLSECDGNVTRAAEKLGIHRRSLQRKLRKPPA